MWRDRLGLLLGLAALPFLAGQVWSAMQTVPRAMPQAMPQAMSACVEVARG